MKVKELMGLLAVCGLGLGVAGCGVEQAASGAEGGGVAVKAEGVVEASGVDPDSGSDSGSGSGSGGRGPGDGGKSEVWYDTEPTDPWEKYVWRSQQFVDDPIEVPAYEAGAKGAQFFQGRRNYCSPEVKRRLDLVGFHATDEEFLELVHVCTFQEKESSGGEYPAGPISIVRYAFGADGVKDLGEGRYLLESLGETVCHVRLDESSDLYVGFGDVLNGGSFDEFCSKAYQVSLIIGNIEKEDS
ncbi:MAG TPA: hypothetical protein H9867_00980 [Candidatus Corynebacterium gallistercoris]|uniref:Uncharacterized protein n=1 Tax=Candidatus Corynebacterium gallistercoris TaxID=2838530 RepID=A0A9D1UPP4_9CORY|nr:hypothetical protein [Candidatus Corynebacterium gallistercoris]